MNDAQILLIAVIVSLTLLLMVLGVQVLIILLDLKKATRRLNSILGDSIIGGGLIEPKKLTGFIEMLKKDKKMQSHGETEV